MERAVLGAGVERRLTRSQVAERLGVSVGTVRNLERAGQLKPTRENGVNLFDPRQIADLYAARERERPTHGAKRETEGEIAGKCFDMFAQGRSVREIVRRLRLAPDRVRVLRREYRAGDADPAQLETADMTPAEERRWRRETDREFAVWERQMAAAWSGRRIPPIDELDEPEARRHRSVTSNRRHYW